jgi:GGDEF domain-containing protein
VCASVGVALYPDDGTTADVLIQAADRAMYAQKRGRSVA